MSIQDILYKEESYRICGCIFEVNRKLGSGFLEAVYQEALGIEFAKAKIPFEAQKSLQVYYDGILLKQSYMADFVCFDKIIIELKAVKRVLDEHRAQLMNYLAVTGIRLGMLVNFHACPKAEIIRLVR
jgi:GxxExxY protein